MNIYKIAKRPAVRILYFISVDQIDGLQASFDPMGTVTLQRNIRVPYENTATAWSAEGGMKNG